MLTDMDSINMHRTKILSRKDKRMATSADMLDLIAQTRANVRKEMARELLDEIKYGTEGYDDWGVVDLIMVSLARIEDFG